MTDHETRLADLRFRLLMAEARETAILLQLALVRIQAGQIRGHIETTEAEAAVAGLLESVPDVSKPNDPLLQ